MHYVIRFVSKYRTLVHQRLVCSSSATTILRRVPRKSVPHRCPFLPNPCRHKGSASISWSAWAVSCWPKYCHLYVNKTLQRLPSLLRYSHCNSRSPCSGAAADADAADASWADISDFTSTVDVEWACGLLDTWYPLTIYSGKVEMCS